MLGVTHTWASREMRACSAPPPATVTISTSSPSSVKYPADFAWYREAKVTAAAGTVTLIFSAAAARAGTTSDASEQRGDQPDSHRSPPLTG